MKKTIYTQKWLILASVGMGIFLSTIDGSIVNVTLPTFVKVMNTDFATTQWVVLSYLLIITTLLLSMGRLGDMVGKKPVYRTGFIVFTIGSLLCGLSNTIYTLIIFRGVQAIGAAMMMALGIAIITEAFPPQERGRALGIAGSLVSIGIVIGPVIGGFILEHLTWHWIFFVNLPIGVIGTIMVHRFVPDIEPSGKQQFDYKGAFILFISLSCLLLALTLGQQRGFVAPLPITLFVVWAITLLLFLYIESHTPHPMIALNMFQNHLLDINLLSGVLVFICTSGSLILIPFYLEDVLKLDHQTVGLLMSVIPIALGITAPFAGWLSDRMGTRPIIVVGLAFIFAGYLYASTLKVEMSLTEYIVRFLPIGIGIGIFQSPNNSAIMGSVTREKLGITSGLLSISRTLGQTSGIALIGAFWNGRIYAHLKHVNALSAPSPEIQVAALQETFWLISAIIMMAFFLASAGLLLERRYAKRLAQTTQ